MPVVSKAISHASPVVLVALSPDGARAVSVDAKGTVLLWPVSGKSPPTTLPAPMQATAATFSRSGKAILLGTKTGALVLVDARSGARLDEHSRHRAAVRGVAFLEGDEVVSVSADRSLQVGELTATKPRLVLRRTKPLRGLAVSEAGEVLVCSEGATLSIFRVDGRTASEVWKDRSSWAPADAVHFLDAGEHFLATKQELLSYWSRTDGLLGAGGNAFDVFAASDPTSRSFVVGRETYAPGEGVLSLVELRAATAPDELLGARAVRGCARVPGRVRCLAIANGSVICGVADGRALVLYGSTAT